MTSEVTCFRCTWPADGTCCTPTVTSVLARVQWSTASRRYWMRMLLLLLLVLVERPTLSATRVCSQVRLRQFTPPDRHVQLSRVGRRCQLILRCRRKAESAGQYNQRCVSQASCRRWKIEGIPTSLACQHALYCGHAHCHSSHTTSQGSCQAARLTGRSSSRRLHNGNTPPRHTADTDSRPILSHSTQSLTFDLEWHLTLLKQTNWQTATWSVDCGGYWEWELVDPVLVGTSSDEIHPSLVIVATLCAPVHVTPMFCRSSANVVRQVFSRLPLAYCRSFSTFGSQFIAIFACLSSGCLSTWPANLNRRNRIICIPDVLINSLFNHCMICGRCPVINQITWLYNK